MTIEQKEKSSVILNVAYKLFNTIGIFSILFVVGAASQKMEMLAFDSIQDKVDTMNHVNNGLTALELYNLSNHINNPDFHMSRDMKDSLYVTREDFEKLVDRLSITSYQTKEQLIEINNLIRAINRKLDR